MTNKGTVGVISLGCDKNRVDTEIMLSALQRSGYEIVNDAALADVLVVNTCAFLESARKESIDTVLEMSAFKKSGRCKKVVVTGCLGQKFGEEIYGALTEADAVVGTNDYGRIAEIIDDTLAGIRGKYVSCNSASINDGERVLTTGAHTAYLRIADGCDNFCTYCLIPHIRGRYRSRNFEDIVREAETLAEQGVKELIVVAQDTTRYGIDLYGSYRLAELLHTLSLIKQVEWIRLMYCYPEAVSEVLISEIESNPKIVKYIDIPLQHINDKILKKMNRRSDKASIYALFDRLCSSSAGISVRSTFICGFPGETEETVAEIENFLQKYKLRNVGFFPYSKEEGTSAANFEEQIDKRKKEALAKRLYKYQQKISAEIAGSDVNKVYRCIVDGFVEKDGELLVYSCRSEFMSPEIDGTVYVASHKQLEAGSFCNARITSALDYDLMGETV